MSWNMATDWDPIKRKSVQEFPSAMCSKRIKSDLSALATDRPYGIYVASDEEDLLNLHALILGPKGSPYENGFFYFFLRIPPDYPWRPPRVKLMTTGGGSVRFNPNLYKDGKVCLSILGTWSGPGWTAALTLSSVLISIQSLMNEYPYYNEPGYEIKGKHVDAVNYNEMIVHETLRVAVVGMLQDVTGLALPASLMSCMKEQFLENYDYYERVCREKMSLDGKFMVNPMESIRGAYYQYRSISMSLQVIRDKLISER